MGVSCLKLKFGGIENLLDVLMKGENYGDHVSGIGAQEIKKLVRTSGLIKNNI